MLKSLKYKLQNLKTYSITLLFKKERREFFWNIYVYMRWVDDIIDDMTITKDFKRHFLETQRRKIEKMYQGKKPHTYEELCLYNAIQANPKKELKKHILNMFWTFEYDTNRINKKVKEREFLKYSNYIGSAYAFVFMQMFDVKKFSRRYDKDFKKYFGKTLKETASDYAHYCHLAHVIRDEKKDIKLGYNNFPTEKHKELWRKKIRKEFSKIRPWRFPISLPLKIALTSFALRFGNI
ncbi:squalene/phytoene synthase family protein [Candidatus Woesearchaeota archaeon]|nr:squalene/phytoene synthase family protein [Candidatus Woesearchaeota archaeon]